MVSATVGNFVINTGTGTVSGNVNGGSESVTLFDLDPNADGGIGLDISEELAGALTSVFDAPNLTGAQFGIANTPVSPVPLPAGAPLLIVALGALAYVRRKQAA